MSDNDAQDSNMAQPVAGGGLLDRRLFLKNGLALSAGAALAGHALESRAGEPSWMKTPGEPFTNYGRPSLHEKEAIRWISANSGAPGNGISWTPLHKLEGIITPNGLHFERHHNGVPQIDPNQHRLLIHGLVKNSLSFGIDDLLRYPMVSRLCFVECGGNSNAGWHEEPIQTPVGYFHGLASCSEWTGVPLAVILEEAGLQPDARWLIAEGADAAAMNISIPVEKALDDAILALYQNGERLRPENGYPLRLILPGWEAVLNVKWLRRLQAANQPVMARNETAKYTELQPSGKARQFTFIIEAKSIITFPSPGESLRGPGLYQISGLAWSGRGRIRRVDVSADGGRSWAEAALQEPVLPQCFTRFRLPWRWDGSPLVLKSRAVDETGYVQPERQALVAERGRHGYFHYNAIVSWAVAADGTVSHVYA
ncbi:sulfite dehydrogenase [Methylocaldum sp.]|uniref:sulfite dehydrogenase n=1 Tax=Methylocaldum sp. TaxID=1969727 RepID=UPI002D25150F|nr:sulfite dehydrogenase [Methylocaldum sp.]HYE37864.1 sulfite dehydrogenase [Methylocaldum sp.]